MTRRKAREKSTETRKPRYHNLKNPFTPQELLADDRIEHIHDCALRVLQEAGLKILLPEARSMLAKSGATVDDDSQMVFIGKDIVEEVLKTAPRSFQLKSVDPERSIDIDDKSMIFFAAGGCPNATDRIRGRRPGSASDFEELIQIVETFDVLPTLNAVVEPQDIPVAERHYKVMQIQTRNSLKPPFIYARGTQQVEDGFKMIALANNLTMDEFKDSCWTKTVINTNSPRQIDQVMAQGIIDFAKYQQLCIVTPFCLMGAMAPITPIGALVLQHAEALAGIALNQIANPGAPVMYGSFASNVDMKSGAPAFGTPEHIKASIISGQLARYIGLPWRGSSGATSNVADAQGAHETELSTWAAILAGSNFLVHSAGWLEGGLTTGYEKLIMDIEMVQTISELAAESNIEEDDFAVEAIASVEPGGHFFAAEHTMKRYRTAFYEPLIADWSNFGTWESAGGKYTDERATEIWQKILENFKPPEGCDERVSRLTGFIEKRMSEGGAPPVS